MGVFRPGSENHAVEQAVVGVRLQTSAPEALFQHATDKAASLASEYQLPGRLTLDPFSLAWGRQIITPGYHPIGQLTPGVLFQRINPAGDMAEEMVVERGAVTYRTRNYKRWADVERVVRDILCPVVSILADNAVAAISVVELRCIDHFISEGSGPPILSDLIRSDTALVPSALLESSEMLHCHLGWFDSVTESGRFLTNFNLDVADNEAGNRAASILQVISHQASGIGRAFADEPTVSQSILAEFTSLHMRDKALLAQLITLELQQKINLAGSSGIGNIL